ncbi:low molecular weight protein-tyrosine-phosphatase [Lachnospira multipara]|uniref:low molecular weight protein-tyrosine-phosphatase n=1 Tax=Lachnospira multipara TaxID=28051 RepID=UPI0004E280C4|nr:low molecular weight protein-tyrosine-phosphatase [Lachnospira multipara]
MIKILFICHGNICRSPMAEFIMKDKIKKMGREGEFYVESAATSSEEIWRGVGNPVYPPARDVLRAHGIDCAGKRARQIVLEDYDNFDLLIAMDENNIRNMRRLWKSDPENKIHLMMEYAGLKRGVADPWYTGDFNTTWDDIELGVTRLLESL